MPSPNVSFRWQLPAGEAAGDHVPASGPDNAGPHGRQVAMSGTVAVFLVALLLLCGVAILAILHGDC